MCTAAVQNYRLVDEQRVREMPYYCFIAVLPVAFIDIEPANAVPDKANSSNATVIAAMAEFIPLSLSDIFLNAPANNTDIFKSILVIMLV